VGIRLKLKLDGKNSKRARACLRLLIRSRRKAATIGIFVLALWLGAHVIFAANGMMVYQQKRSEYRRLQTEINDLQQENERYTDQIKSLKSDPNAIEKEAREQLRYARPGEVIYVVPADSQSNRPQPNSAKK
jgi:cell division protein FtsB